MIIVNSDDFAASPSINKATHIAFKKGLISSTSAIMNFKEGLIDAVCYIEKNKIDTQAIGIHLNLTQGIPLTEKIKDNPKFCTDGSFNDNRSSTRIFTLDLYSKLCVYEELEAQMNLFIEKFGFSPSHIDSHQHIHTEWAIANCVVKLAKNYKIKCIRLSRNTGVSNSLKKKIYKILFNNYIRFKGFKVTDKFGDINDLVISKINSTKNYEIMVHATMSSDKNDIVDFDNENLNQKLLGLFKQNSWKLINYTEFCEK